MTKVQAAVGLVQLRRLDEMNARRIQRARQRSALLEEIPELQLPTEPTGFEHVYYLYTVMVKPDWAGQRRDELIRIMKEEFKIGCVIGNPPSYHLNELLRERTAGQRLPLSDELGLRLFCPSLHPLMTDEENRYVAAALSATVERLQG
jgi:perosamine synthetase